MPIRWKQYDAQHAWDELVTASGRARPGAAKLLNALAKLSDDELRDLQGNAERAIASMGITFTVYTGEGSGSIDREWPFDVIPRVIAKREWDRICSGLTQRVKALNAFIDDVYNDKRCLADKVLPAEFVLRSNDYREQCEGITPAHGIWSHICGSDLVRDADGTVYVLEDNLRVPSGVSYMIENRAVLKRTYPELFENQKIYPVDDYPAQLARTLASLSEKSDPEIVVLTPGIYNSAYFEHAYLAQAMGCELVEGSDLTVGSDDCVYMRTIEGLVQVDVIYRRIDDAFLDPEAFREDSTLGVAGLIRSWQAGNVALANAPGCGVADDKVIYTYVPELIRYYLDEEPELANVPSYRCAVKAERDYVLDNLDKLVVKPANESGGYGMIIGPHASKKERATFARQIRANPRNYMAQPMLTLSTAPTLFGTDAEPRHLDLRPFILSGEDSYVTMGGLTRVAMRKGSMVVNSSQGGGSKDTWVVDPS